MLQSTLRPVLLALTGGFFALGWPVAVSAQSWDGDWSVEGSVGGMLSFGSSQQTSFSSEIELERSDDMFESSTDFSFDYGVSTDSEGVTQLHERAWSAAGGLTFRPGHVVSPFVSGRMSSSYRRNIALRYDAGAGLRVARVEDRRNRIDFSLQVLAERTYSRGDGGGLDEEVSLTRWSSELRVRRTVWEDRVALDTRNRYRPVFDEIGNFTLSSNNSATLQVTDVIGLRFGFVINHDSRAVSRGADTNRDGQVTVSIVAGF